MSSFTDKSPQFNPYIQQLPVEEMAKMGMLKQEQYNQGYQKIQTSIDNVAGLDIVRDVDKQYLQSKLNQLGDNLKEVSAGDFSNFQLVNSVTGMSDKMAKDNNIINAVSSTNAYKKGIAEMNAANKEGKGSPSNDYDFKKGASAWLNSNSVDDTFNGSYQPYTDYKKHSLEVIKSLTKDESITDRAFHYDDKGQLVIDDSVVRTKLAGISPEKIQQALMVGLTPADFKQMEIDGKYQYSNLEGENFFKAVSDNYKEKFDSFSAQKEVLTNAIDSTTDVGQKSRIQEQILALDNTLKGITSEYEGISKTFESGDADSAKARLHTSNFISGFSRAFSFTETSQTQEANPLADIAMRRDIKNQDWQKFKSQYEQDERQFATTTELKQQELALKSQENDLKQKELEGYGGLPSPVNQADLPKMTLAKVVSDTDSMSKNIESSDTLFIKQQGKDTKWLDQQREAWTNNPSSVDPIIAYHFNSTESNRRTVDANKTMIAQINKDAQTAVGEGDIYSKISKNAPSLNITTLRGTVNITPKEIVDFNSNVRKYISFVGSGGSGGGGGQVVYNDALAKKELSDKEFKLYEVYKKADKLGKDKLSKGEKIIYDNIENYRNKINVPYANTLKKINEYTAAEVQKRTEVKQGLEYTIPTANAAQKSSIASMLTSVANLAETQKGKIAGSPNFDVAVAREIATDSEAKYNIKVVEGTSNQPAMYEVTATGNDGNIVQFKLTPEQKRSIFGNQFEATSATQAARPYQEQIRKMGGYSTGLAPGKTNVSNAYLNKIDFPNTSIYGVTGNLVSPDGSNYSIRLNLRDPLTGKWHEDIAYPKTGLMSEDKIVPAMQNLSDTDVFELINNRKATAAELKQIKEASKKPL
jgi:hypothetical protein